MKGVLKSWAVPKGLSCEPKEKRLAILVDDHSLDYADFEGTIPEGSYGAGEVIVWDRGNYELLSGSFESKKLGISFKGRKIAGTYTLFEMKNKKGQWLIMRKD